jgi:hypothetical protein
MEWGRGFRQIRPWGIAENMPVRHRLPVAIKPHFSFVWGANVFIDGLGTQDQPPDVRLNPGVVQWSGSFSQGPLNFRWVVEHLRQDHIPGYLYSFLAVDDFGSTFLEHRMWNVGDNPWGHPFGFDPSTPVNIFYSGLFISGGFVNGFPRTYAEEP